MGNPHRRTHALHGANAPGERPVMWSPDMPRRHVLNLVGRVGLSVVGGAWATYGSGAPRASLSNPEGRPPALVLAKSAQGNEDPTDYLVSEKLDGVRAFWTGTQMLHRSGAVIALPESLAAGLPSHELDGELWLGRGRFDDMAALLRRTEGLSSSLWRQVRYALFELPNAPGGFDQRVAALHAMLIATPMPGVQVVPQRRVPDGGALTRWLHEVVQGGGEGLVLHRASAPYVTGRTPWVLKFKPLEDAEAVVVGHLPGRGRHEGRLGALQVRNEAGHIFALGAGLTDAQRDAPPPLGTVVVYRYRGLTKHGVPRFATFWRLAGP